jgi:predicted membrane protein
MTRSQILAALLAVAITVWVIDLVRRRKLSEEYSLLSLIAMAGVVVLAFWTQGLTWFTRLVGALYETSVIFFFGLVFVLVALLYYAVKLTALTQEVRRLAQELALLRRRVEVGEDTGGRVRGVPPVPPAAGGNEPAAGRSGTES